MIFALHPRAEEATRLLVFSHLPIAARAAGIYLTVVVVASLVWLRLPDIGITPWQISLGVVKWIVFGYSISFAFVHLPVYVAHGFTRRHFHTGALVAIGVLAVAAGFVVSLGWGAQSIIFNRFGAVHGALTDLPVALALTRTFIEYTWTAFAYQAAGLWIGAVFYAYGTPRALLWIVPALLLITGAEQLAPTVSGGEAAIAFARLGIALRINPGAIASLSFLLLLAGLVSSRRVLARAAIR